jgi:hypothetical protein
MSAATKRHGGTREYRLLVRVLAVSSVIRMLLPLVPLKRLVRWLAPSGPSPTPHPVCLQTVAWYTDAVLQRLPYRRRGNCLPRSLTLFYFASRAGLPVRVHCGVRRAGPRLEGHAWLTLGGELFLEPGDLAGSYSVTFSYPDPLTPERPAEVPAYPSGPHGAHQ